jgi:hypothetical protein
MISGKRANPTLFGLRLVLDFKALSGSGIPRTQLCFSSGLGLSINMPTGPVMNILSRVKQEGPILIGKGRARFDRAVGHNCPRP